ncbi:acyl-CoA thioesterase-1 [Yoonia tamlensis]|uniref:Acyl-CoA thioesterase-1 n=1 Tax=Yoonia tamlensis TaxID=390270 RepID=A0A1I6GYH4_9RHOB|nr:arylesterase [Yoonia tamlensis]SFR47091.1 acyl-CoA thioesterase-1 [Yoonia tamlensis]
MMSLGYGAFGGLRNLSFGVLLTTGAVHAETVTIAALGDSLTAGYGLQQDQGFVPQLQAWLDANGADVKLINAGVSGDTTAGGRSRVDWTLTPDVDAMIVALGGNDYLRGIDPAVSRENLDAILAAGADAGVAVLLLGLDVGANYGPDYETAFEQTYVDLAAKYDVLLYPDMLAGVRRAAQDGAGLAGLLQADGLHPNPDGVGHIVADFGPVLLGFVQRLGHDG